jgi:Mg2+/Co2+ transporter CorB
LSGLLFIILIGILADIIGTAVTAAQEAPFHAKAAKRVRGAKEGVFLLRNADKVANICNDVIGDIVGTVSGALGISIVVKIINNNPDIDTLIANILMTALIASMTVSCKALGKTLAIERANDVIFFVGKILAQWGSLTSAGPAKRDRNRA